MNDPALERRRRLIAAGWQELPPEHFFGPPRWRAPDDRIREEEQALAEVERAAKETT